MSRWISYLHRCIECEHEWDELHDRTDIQDYLPCPECESKLGKRVLFANVSTSKTSQTRPDIGGRYNEGQGTRQDLKEHIALRKEARRLKQQGDTAASKDVRKESKKLGGNSI